MKCKFARSGNGGNGILGSRDCSVRFNPKLTLRLHVRFLTPRISASLFPHSANSKIKCQSEIGTHFLLKFKNMSPFPAEIFKLFRGIPGLLAENATLLRSCVFQILDKNLSGRLDTRIRSFYPNDRERRRA